MIGINYVLSLFYSTENSPSLPKNVTPKTLLRSKVHSNQHRLEKYLASMHLYITFHPMLDTFFQACFVCSVDDN